MKRLGITIGAAFLVACTLLFCSGCAEDAATVVDRYTEETAKAIIQAGSQIATAIIGAAFIRGFLNK